MMRSGPRDVRERRVNEFDLVVGADGLHSRVRRLVFGPDESFEKYLGIVASAFEAQGYRPRDELIAMMHAEVGFQAVRNSLRDDDALPGSQYDTTAPCPPMVRAHSKLCCGPNLPGRDGRFRRCWT